MPILPGSTLQKWSYHLSSWSKNSECYFFHFENHFSKRERLQIWLRNYCNIHWIYSTPLLFSLNWYTEPTSGSAFGPGILKSDFYFILQLYFFVIVDSPETTSRLYHPEFVEVVKPIPTEFYLFFWNRIKVRNGTATHFLQWFIRPECQLEKVLDGSRVENEEERQEEQDESKHEHCRLKSIHLNKEHRLFIAHTRSERRETVDTEFTVFDANWNTLNFRKSNLSARNEFKYFYCGSSEKKRDRNNR